MRGLTFSMVYWVMACWAVSSYPSASSPRSAVKARLLRKHTNFDGFGLHLLRLGSGQSPYPRRGVGWKAYHVGRLDLRCILPC